jgi:hypothetical protein
MARWCPGYLRMCQISMICAPLGRLLQQTRCVWNTTWGNTRGKSSRGTGTSSGWCDRRIGRVWGHDLPRTPTSHFRLRLLHSVAFLDRRIPGTKLNYLEICSLCADTPHTAHWKRASSYISDGQSRGSPRVTVRKGGSGFSTKVRSKCAILWLSGRQAGRRVV